MPKGKGTYGSKVGRPPKKAKGYQAGGAVEMRNPMVTNAMDRSQNIQGYGDGGKVDNRERKYTVTTTGTGGTSTKTLTGEAAKKAAEKDRAGQQKRVDTMKAKKAKIKSDKAKRAKMTPEEKKKAAAARRKAMFDELG
tara:strand:- start:1517 stop:1930 length:414 start_codon:yes stop_codon:yes gene_type:complete